MMNKDKSIGYRPTWAEINLNNLTHNFRMVKKNLAPFVKVMACVKADAYGHGLIPVAKALVRIGVDYLSVASIDEGIKLRKAGIKIPILVLGMVLKEDIRPLFDYNLTQNVCSLDFALTLNRLGKRLNKKINVHLKIDTGMGRLGVLHKDAVKFVEEVNALENLNIEGIFTHLACADNNKSFTSYQIGLFEDIITELKKKGIRIPFIHAANSLGITSYKSGHFNMVRPGIILYGLYPKRDMDIKLKPVLSLKTKVVYIKEVPSGWGISYGHIYVTNRKTKIVTLPIGYGDGYPRHLSNKGPVLIRGKRFKISGRVCMDQIMIDVGSFNVSIGDEVVLMGHQKRNKIGCEEIARLINTIPYEIVCGLGSRIPRIYQGPR